MAEGGRRFELNDDGGEDDRGLVAEKMDVGVDKYDPCLDGEGNYDIISEGTPFKNIVNLCPQPPLYDDMSKIHDKNYIFMIAPFKYDPKRPELEPTPINLKKVYQDRWDADHVRMPCSPSNMTNDRRSKWLTIRQLLIDLKKLCDKSAATSEHLLRTIDFCVQENNDMSSLKTLIDHVYSHEERGYFMSRILSNICELAINVDIICSRPLPLLRQGKDQSVTLSQRQAASLLACEFFCVFPFRSDRRDMNRFGQFPKINFNRLYSSGPPKKIEKLRCILNYFRQITENMPTGVITIQRFALSHRLVPEWSRSKKGLCDVHLTTGKRIEEVYNVLQVDFANKYIGGGVLGNGCVQEEIRFTICPEMLISLLVCEKMEPNECIFLMGCEQYSLYTGYSDSFKFVGHHEDVTPKDNWGRKWCHLVAMDAIYFRNASEQYNMESTRRELLKAYTGFRPLAKGANYEFGIATGNWGCGAFNGDRQLKAIIQLMAASKAGRPLIYAAYRDKNLVTPFAVVLEYLKTNNATVGDLYRYLDRYFTEVNRGSLFEYILATPVPSVKS